MSGAELCWCLSVQPSGAATVAVVFWVVIPPAITREGPRFLAGEGKGDESHSSILCRVVIAAEGDGMALSAHSKSKATTKVNQPHSIQLLGYQPRLTEDFEECFGPGLPLAVA